MEVSLQPFRDMVNRETHYPNTRTRIEIADACGMSLSMINAIMSGSVDSISLASAARIMEAMRCDFSDIVSIK